MTAINVNDKAYVIKKSFPHHQVKDNMDTLSEVKGYWGADTVINQKSKGVIHLCETIQDATILEEWEGDEPIKLKESGSSE